MKTSPAFLADGGMAHTAETGEQAEPQAPRESGKQLPLESQDLTLTTTIEYRDGLIEYVSALRNDGGRPVEEVSLVPSVPPEAFMADPPHATIGPLAAGQSGSATFLLEPMSDFENLILARPVVEGRDVEIRSVVRSRKGSITCEVELVNRQGMLVRGLEVSPLLPEGYVSTVPSKRVDLAPRDRVRLVFNVLPKSEFAVAERRGKRSAFSPRGVSVREPSPGDIPRSMPAELRPLPPYSRARVHKPGLKVESKAMRGLMARSEVREVLRAEEVVPEDIEIRMVKGVKAAVRKPSAKAAGEEPAREAEPAVEERRERRPARRAEREPEPEPEVERFEETFRDEIRRGREISAGAEEDTSEPISEYEAAEEGAGEAAGAAPEVEAEAGAETEGEDAQAVDPEHPPCPDCGNGLDWVQEYERWYCYTCEKYPW